MVESNAAFTKPGDVQVLFTADDAVNIEPGTSPCIYTPSGNHLNGQFADAQLVTSYNFPTTGAVNTGTIDTYTLYDSTLSNSAGALAMLSHFCAANAITLIQVEAATATVAATYAGFSNSTLAGPTLIVEAEAGLNGCGSNHIPVGSDINSVAPFSAAPG